MLVLGEYLLARLPKDPESQGLKIDPDRGRAVFAIRLGLPLVGLMLLWAFIIDWQFSTFCSRCVLRRAVAATASAPEPATSSAKSDLVACGTGRRTPPLLGRPAYDATLLLSECPADAILQSLRPRAISLTMLEDFTSSEFGRVVDNQFRHHAGKDLEKLQKELDYFKGLLPDLKAKDQVRIGYDVRSGTTVSVLRGGAPVPPAGQGNRDAPLPGADFARVLFSIWLGDRIPDDDDDMKALREALLGRLPGLARRDQLKR
jgi:chalcone isomerase-like protein